MENLKERLFMGAMSGCSLHTSPTFEVTDKPKEAVTPCLSQSVVEHDGPDSSICKQQVSVLEAV